MPTVPRHAKNIPRIPDWNTSPRRRPTGTLFELACDNPRTPRQPHQDWESHTHRDRVSTPRGVPTSQAMPHPPRSERLPPNTARRAPTAQTGSEPMSRPSRMRFSTHRPSYPPPGMPDTERPATGSQTARLEAKKQSGEHLNERTGFEIPGYQGHMHGYHQTFGGSRARVVTDAETGRLPILKAPMPIPSRSYYEMSPERSKDYKGPRPQGLVRNKSCVYIGDERQSHFQTSLSEDFKDWTSDDTSVNPLPTRKEIERVYHDATKRVPQWRVDEIENAMRAKIEQKTRGGAFVFRRAFKYFDRDGSGGVDLKELRDGMPRAMAVH